MTTVPKAVISIASDHGGIVLRGALTAFLKQQHYSVVDHGTHVHGSVDYPDMVWAVAQDLIQGKAQYGVLVCTSGVGMSIAANKYPGLRAALVFNEDTAHFARQHNHANVICFGQKYITPYLGQKYLQIFLDTPTEAGRHLERVKKLEALPHSSRSG